MDRRSHIKKPGMTNYTISNDEGSTRAWNSPDNQINETQNGRNAGMSERRRARFAYREQAEAQRLEQEEQRRLEQERRRNRRLHKEGPEEAYTMRKTDASDPAEEKAKKTRSFLHLSTQKKPKKQKNGEGPKSYYDFTLIFLIICLSAFGLVMLYSTTSYTDQLAGRGAFSSTLKQLGYVLAGLVGMIAVSVVFDYHKLARFAYLIYAGGIISCLLLFTPLAISSHGKKRWVRLAGIQFQPAEVVKLALIIFLAVLMIQIAKRWNGAVRVIIISLVILLPTALITRSNLSSGIIILLIGFIMFFVTAKYKWPFFVFAIVGIAAVVGVYQLGLLDKVLQGYQMDRINAWLNPMAYKDDEAYQTVQSLYAIASGGLTGKGLGQSIQKLGYLPEAQNDMIFAIICEELGLFGAGLVVLLFGMMIWRFTFIAANAPDLLGSMLTMGVLIHISLQVIFNIAVATSVMPNTGVGLPFISSGGSAVVILMAEMAIVLNVSKQIKAEA